MFGFGTTNSLTMDKPRPNSLLDTGVQGSIGRPFDRVDGPKKVSGAATYAAEYAFDNLAYGFLVSSRIGAGKVVVDRRGCCSCSIPGVIDVVVDFDRFIRVSQPGWRNRCAPTQGVQGHRLHGRDRRDRGRRKLRGRARRRAAIPGSSMSRARARSRSMQHRHEAYTPPDGVTPAHFAQGDLDTAMAEAPVTLDVTYVTPSQNSAAMEPHASIAVWDDDGALTLYGAYQMPTSDASQLAKSLGLSAKKVRIVSRYIGGGFGSKLGIAPESVAAAIAAKQIGRPVKAVMARQQVFEATVRRSNTEQRLRLAATADGKLTAIGQESLVSNQPGEDFFEPVGIGTHLIYAGENRLITHDQVPLNLVLSGSMRAPGEAVGMVGLECAMDELAEKLGLDPVELRRINDTSVDPEKGVPFSSRSLTAALDEGAKRFGWEKRGAAWRTP